jgi:AICAR transformylase/IMP cyclohydrolase PurH
VSQIKTAFLSAHDRTGLAEFASELAKLNDWQIVGCAETVKYLSGEGIPIKEFLQDDPLPDFVYLNLCPAPEEIAKAEGEISRVAQQIDVDGVSFLLEAVAHRRYVLCQPDQLALMFPYIFVKKVESDAFLSHLSTVVLETIGHYTMKLADHHDANAGDFMQKR